LGVDRTRAHDLGGVVVLEPSHELVGDGLAGHLDADGVGEHGGGPHSTLPPPVHGAGGGGGSGGGAGGGGGCVAGTGVGSHAGAMVGGDHVLPCVVTGGGSSGGSRRAG